MIDTEGRKPYSKLRYYEVGKNVSNLKKISDFKWLEKKQIHDVPLYPQRTVVQFNSTYMELIGRQDRIRGDVTVWGLFFFGLVTYALYVMGVLFLIIFANSAALGSIIILFVIILLGILTHVLPLLSTELLTYTYLPIRFNRKTRKVYVRQANRRVEVFDWDKLQFYMATTYKDGSDVRGITLAHDGVTITGMFSLPFVYLSASDYLIYHFEFVRRYMEGDDKQLEEVKDAIRYIHPVHEKRETPLVSFQRTFIDLLNPYDNLEYPKQAFEPDIGTAAILIPTWLRYLGRLLSINTSITPKFSPEIEAECKVDPNDPHDINKYLPEGNIEDANQPIWKKLVFSVSLILLGIVMMFAFALFVDMIGSIRGHYPNVVGKLWYVVNLGWL